MALSDNVRKYRIAAKMSQEHLAKEAGIDQSSVCKIERGVLVPTVMTLDDISRVLHVSLDELVHGTDS